MARRRVRCAWTLAPDRLVRPGSRSRRRQAAVPGIGRLAPVVPAPARGRGEACRSTCPASTMLERGPDHLPTGRVLSTTPARTVRRRLPAARRARDRCGGQVPSSWSAAPTAGSGPVRRAAGRGLRRAADGTAGRPRTPRRPWWSPGGRSWPTPPGPGRANHPRRPDSRGCLRSGRSRARADPGTARPARADPRPAGRAGRRDPHLPRRERLAHRRPPRPEPRRRRADPRAAPRLRLPARHDHLGHRAPVVRAQDRHRTPGRLRRPAAHGRPVRLPEPRGVRARRRREQPRVDRAVVGRRAGQGARADRRARPPRRGRRHRRRRADRRDGLGGARTPSRRRADRSSSWSTTTPARTPRRSAGSRTTCRRCARRAATSASSSGARACWVVRPSSAARCTTPCTG